MANLWRHWRDIEMCFVCVCVVCLETNKLDLNSIKHHPYIISLDRRLDIPHTHKSFAQCSSAQSPSLAKLHRYNTEFTRSPDTFQHPACITNTRLLELCSLGCRRQCQRQRRRGDCWGIWFWVYTDNIVRVMSPFVCVRMLCLCAHSRPDVYACYRNEILCWDKLRACFGRHEWPAIVSLRTTIKSRETVRPCVLTLIYPPGFSFWPDEIRLWRICGVHFRHDFKILIDLMSLYELNRWNVDA